MSEIIRKNHNVNVLIYHIVCPAKYRRAIISEEKEKKLQKVCMGIAARYEIKFLEIGSEKDHVHFLVQSVPTYSPTEIARIIKAEKWDRKYLAISKSWRGRWNEVIPFLNSHRRYGKRFIRRMPSNRLTITYNGT